MADSPQQHEDTAPDDFVGYPDRFEGSTAVDLRQAMDNDFQEEIVHQQRNDRVNGNSPGGTTVEELAAAPAVVTDQPPVATSAPAANVPEPEAEPTTTVITPNIIVPPRDETVPITYREALREALREELALDENVFLLGEEIGIFEGSYKVTAGLFDQYGPNRIRETPISEEGFVGAAVGAAMLGQRPVVEIMTLNFILVAMDQVVNHAAKVHYMFGGEVDCPLVIRTPNGAGNQLTAQHSQSFDQFFAHVPGLKVVAPATPADAKGMLKTAIRDNDPVLFLENLPLYKEKGLVPVADDYLVPFGQANIARTGTDITFVAHSFAVVRALQVAQQLQEEHDISAEVVDLRSLRPLDMVTVAASVQKTSRALCIEEGWATYGVTAEIAARISDACFDDLDAPVGRVGMAEVPMPYAKNLENAALPNNTKILGAALHVLGKS